jgi:hypothetical protein
MACSEACGESWPSRPEGVSARKEIASGQIRKARQVVETFDVQLGRGSADTMEQISEAANEIEESKRRWWGEQRRTQESSFSVDNGAAKTRTDGG